MEYYIKDEGKLNIITRCINEFSLATEYAAFAMRKASEGDIDFTEEIIDKLIEEAVDKKIQYELIVGEIVNSEVKATNWTIERNEGRICISAENIEGGDIECYKEPEEPVEDTEFSTQIEKMYPEKVGLTRNITFQVTDECNLACSYCYQICKGTKAMSIDTARKVIDNIFGYKYQLVDKDTCGLVIDMIGGEPFLQCELIDKIIEYTLKKIIMTDSEFKYRIRFGLTSNGTLYTEEEVQKLLNKYGKDTLISLGVTVDGFKELHDSCRKFKDGRPSYDLAHFAEVDWARITSSKGTKITLAPENIIYLNKAFCVLLDEGFRNIHANFVFENVWQKKDALIAYEQIKEFTNWHIKKYTFKYQKLTLMDPKRCIGPMEVTENNNPCGGDGEMLAVGPQGDLYPCLRFMESSLGEDQKPLKIGSADTKYDYETAKSLNTTRRRMSTPECFLCVNANGCRSCSGYDYQVNGTVHKRTTYICDVYKATALATAYYTNKHKELGEDIEPADVYISKDDAIELIGKDNYDELVQLTKKVGGFVNETGCEYVFKHTENGNTELEFVPDNKLEEYMKRVDLLLEHEEKLDKHRTGTDVMKNLSVMHGDE
jgi:radical SAM peptide maturase (CXXX-repeat target family)